MANSSSARKRIRSASRKHEQNRGVRSAVRTAVAKARREVLQAAPEGAEELVRLASSALDKAAEHGVIHRRNASRRKSRLMLLAAKAGAAEKVASAVAAPKRKATATKSAKGGSAAKKTAATKSRTKTERTAARTRRAAGSTGSERA